MANLLSRVPLPAWAQMDHPLVQREMDVLPNFLGTDGNLNVKMLLMAVVGLGLVSCSCSCGGVWWPVIMSALGLLPLLWGAMLVNREQAARRWEVLRATPYSVREILLAKVTAALYRLSPLLALVLAGQVMSYFLASWMMNFFFASAMVSVNGSDLTRLASSPASSSLVLAGMGLTFVVMLFSTLLDFVLALVLGLLASTLVQSRGWAFAGAIGLRVLAAILLGGLNLLVTWAVLGGTEGAAGVMALQTLGGAGSLFAVSPSVGLLLAAGASLLFQVGLLVGAFRLAEARASA